MTKHIVLPETSNHAPAVAVNLQAQLLVSWIGVGNDQINFLVSNDGENVADKVALDETSSNAPAVTCMHGTYYAAWTGVGNKLLNVFKSDDGRHWTKKVTLPESSDSAPALVAVGNTLFLAWRGTDNNAINVLESIDGDHWTNKQTSDETTTSGPTLGALGSVLFVGWRGEDDKLNVMQREISSGQALGQKVTLDEKTTARPYLASVGNELVLAWQGTGNHYLNSVSSNDGLTFSDTQTIESQSSYGGVAATNYKDEVYWVWTGTNADHNLNISPNSAIS
ncbi:hypothetical protein CS022_21430 [Veronia nyctiphanis]|uniref:Uncharacterized protein n=1 Tax=Veronia nyctiphanis TaxID=1278244 RepID=A0A4Q0YKG6_9GAMM|nr:hypothetical protein [Veronia nyctiphanis]RXJ71227.1 hypothetical protein CS022_21430 [Veronia nyctiphanis]